MPSGRTCETGTQSSPRAAALELLDSAPETELPILEALLARALVRIGVPAEALRRATAAWKSRADWETGLAYGEARLAAGDVRGAVETLDLAENMRRSIDDNGDARPPENARVTLAVARADAARALGDWEGATKILQSVAADRRRIDPLDEADRLAALGSCAILLGDYTSARAALETALTLYDVNPGSTDVASTLDGLGRLARHRDQPVRAVELHRAALERWVERLGPRSAPVASCRHALAQALHRTGDFAGALAEMELAADRTARAFGEAHADTWISRFELGRFEMDVGRSFEGLARMEEARRRVAQLLGQDHPVVAAMSRWL